MSFYLIYSLVSLNILTEFNSKKNNFLNTSFYWLLGFIKTLLYENALTQKNTYFYNFAFLFLFILGSNLLGLLPFNWTITSWISLVFYISFSYFFFLNVIFITRKKWNFTEITQPNGTPLLIIPFLTIVEVISFLSRVVSLAIRLFANMLSGHCLIKILISFSWSALNTIDILSFFVFACIWLVVVGIFILEILVGFLQAYVFTLLIAIYLSDSLSKDQH